MGAGESKSMRFALIEDIGEGVVLLLVELLPGGGSLDWRRIDSTTSSRTMVSCTSSKCTCTP